MKSPDLLAAIRPVVEALLKLSGLLEQAIADADIEYRVGDVID